MTKEEYKKRKEEFDALLRSNDPGLVEKLIEYISFREFFHQNSIDASPAGIVRRLETKWLMELKSLLAPEPRKNQYQRHLNYTDKNIREFCDLDTIYLNKMNGGYQITYLCRFVSFGKGVVRGAIINAEPNWAMHSRLKNQHITARLDKCYLLGTSDSRFPNSAHWFDKEGYAKK